MAHAPTRMKVLIGGLISQILCLGLARFAYTPLLPVMQEQTALSDAGGGWLAAINYMGYMTGALIAASVSDLVLKDRLYRIGIVLAVVSSLLMPLTTNFVFWSVLRVLAGLSSAASLLLASGLIMNWLLRHQHRPEMGVHFAGIGAGIAVAAIFVDLMVRFELRWDHQWYGLAIGSLLLAFPSWAWIPKPERHNAATAGEHMQDKPPSQRFLWIMMVAYFFAGVGYVVTATFLVAIVERQPAIAGYGNWMFAVLGLAAIPATIIWDRVTRKIGYLYALILGYLLQIFGILMPAISDNLILLFFSAMLFGATFAGCVSMVLSMAGRLYPSKPAKLMGKLTMAYGAAQITAPAITGMVAEQTGNFNAGLWMASISLVLGAMLIGWLRYTDPLAAKL